MDSLPENASTILLYRFSSSSINWMILNLFMFRNMGIFSRIRWVECCHQWVEKLWACGMDTSWSIMSKRGREKLITLYSPICNPEGDDAIDSRIFGAFPLIMILWCYCQWDLVCCYWCHVPTSYSGTITFGCKLSSWGCWVSCHWE